MELKLQGQRKSTRDLSGSLEEMERKEEQSIARLLLSTPEQVLRKRWGKDGCKFRLIHRHRGSSLVPLRASLFSKGEASFLRTGLRDGMTIW